MQVIAYVLIGLVAALIIARLSDSFKNTSPLIMTIITCVILVAGAAFMYWFLFIQKGGNGLLGGWRMVR